nr:hypothetical protein [Nocardiopsis sp. MG754419]
MAMSGARRLAVGLEMVERTPPESILREGVPAMLRGIPEERHLAAIELAHWGYGAAAGAAFGLLPAGLRRWRLTGPVYGVLSWGLFEVALAPALDLAHAHRAGTRERMALLLDHVLFGLIVGEPPEADIVGSEAAAEAEAEAQIEAATEEETEAESETEAEEGTDGPRT